MPDQSTTHPLDRRLAELARRQHGLVTRGQLVALGLGSSAITERALRSVTVHVTAPTRRRVAGVIVHQAPLDGERVRRDGIVATTRARTLIDLADVVPRRALERAFDEAHYLGLDFGDARPRHGRTGSGKLASVLALHRPGTARTRSELESCS